MTSIERGLPPAVVWEIVGRNLYAIEGVKRTRVRPILPAGLSVIVVRPGRALRRTVYS